MITGRRRRSFYGYKISYDNNEVGLLQTTKTETALRTFEVTSFDVLYDQVKTLFIEPLLENQIYILKDNYENKINTISTYNTYINSIPVDRRISIDPNLTIFEFFSREINYYIETYGNENMRYSIIADSINISQKAFNLYDSLVNSQSSINTLQNYIESVLDDYENGVEFNNTESDIPIQTKTTVNASINTTFLKYIQKHGPPKNGVFDVNLLAQLAES